MVNFLSIFFMVAGVVLFLSALIALVFNTDQFESTKEKVKCYDRWNNEIIGAECIEYHDSLGGIISACAFIGIFLIVIGIISFGDNKW